MANESEVARHYSQSGLEQAILNGLKTLGKETEQIDPADLAPADEFHMGGHEATRLFAAALDLRPGMRVLDIGSGIGGPARFLARTFGVSVVGVDLTPEHVEVARALTRRCGTAAGQVSFELGSVVDFPFEPAHFDAATMLHVGMNIADKGGLFRSVHRALKPGAVFAIYDPMRAGEGALTFPLPWASSASGSFLETPDVYHAALEDAGFAVGSATDRRELALDFFRRVRARMAESGPPPLGPHLHMGREAPIKIGNLMAALEAGIVTPVEIVSRRRA